MITGIQIGVFDPLRRFIARARSTQIGDVCPGNALYLIYREQRLFKTAEEI